MGRLEGFRWTGWWGSVGFRRARWSGLCGLAGVVHVGGMEVVPVCLLGPA